MTTHKMKLQRSVLLTGATGLVGRALIPHLNSRQFNTIVLGRSSEEAFRRRFHHPCQYRQWEDSDRTEPPIEDLSISHAIHLMGEPIADGRWTKARKRRLVESRVGTTTCLVKALNQSQPTLEKFLSASAVGYYGDRGDEVLTESSGRGTGFLADLTAAWEGAAQQSSRPNVQLRFGVILDSQGGALAKMLPAFRLNLGGPLGSGRQWMSWIHIADAISAILFALDNSAIQGPVNIVAPTPVQNRDFALTLAATLGKAAPVSVPSMVLKLGLGAMSEVLLASQRVMPAKLTSAGFSCEYQTLSAALSHLVGRSN